MTAKILVIDDDIELTQLLTEYLCPHGYQVVKAHDGTSGIKSINSENPDLILLDIMLPGRDGFHLCKQIRQFSHVPIIMLTARGNVDDRVVGLEIGADDYLGKPFDPRELLLRISSVLKRTIDLKRPTIFSIDNLSINLISREVTKDGKQISLTNSEFDLLALLGTFMNQPVSRERMSNDVLGTKWNPESRSIDIIMSRLRKKIGPDSKGREIIKTIRGIGYMLISENT